MEGIETRITLNTYRRNAKKAYAWLQEKEKEGFKYEESEMTSGKALHTLETDLKIVVTKLEPF